MYKQPVWQHRCILKNSFRKESLSIKDRDSFILVFKSGGLSVALLRTYHKDRYNENKIWEVTKLSGGYYLRQYISGRQTGKGLRTAKQFISDTGIFEFNALLYIVLTSLI